MVTCITHALGVMKWVVGLEWEPGFETQLSTHLCWVSHSVSLSFGFLLWKTVVLMPTFPTSTKRSRGSVWKCMWRRPVSYIALWRPSPPLCCTLPWLTASVTSMEPSVWRACITNLCLFSDKYRWLSGSRICLQCRRLRRCRFDPWVGKIPWRRAWQLSALFLPGESPWTEELGQLQTTVSQRVGDHWRGWAHTSAFMVIRSIKL